MKTLTNLGASVKRLALLVLSAAIALLAMPFGLFASARGGGCKPQRHVFRR